MKKLLLLIFSSIIISHNLNGMNIKKIQTTPGGAPSSDEESRTKIGKRDTGGKVNPNNTIEFNTIKKKQSDEPVQKESINPNNGKVTQIGPNDFLKMAKEDIEQFNKQRRHTVLKKALIGGIGFGLLFGLYAYILHNNREPGIFLPTSPYLIDRIYASAYKSVGLLATLGFFNGFLVWGFGEKYFSGKTYFSAGLPKFINKHVKSITAVNSNYDYSSILSNLLTVDYRYEFLYGVKYDKNTSTLTEIYNTANQKFTSIGNSEFYKDPKKHQEILAKLLSCIGNIITLPEKDKQLNSGLHALSIMSTDTIKYTEK